MEAAPHGFCEYMGDWKNDLLSESDRIRLMTWLYEQHEDSTIDLRSCVLEVDGKSYVANAALGIKEATDAEIDAYQPLDPPEWISGALSDGTAESNS